MNSKVFTQSDTTTRILATHINYKVVARSGSMEVAADAQALLHAVADVQRRVGVFSWTCSKLNHVQPTLPPKGSLARRVVLKSLWAPWQKSRIVLSARQLTCLQLHSERDGILRFRIPTAVPRVAMKRTFSALRVVSLCSFGPNFNCSCEPLSKVAKSWPKSSPP